MYAKLSPCGTRVGWVEHNDIWVQDLESREATQLTTTGSPGHGGTAPVINGNFDWAYEEELSLSDVRAPASRLASQRGHRHACLTLCGGRAGAGRRTARPSHSGEHHRLSARHPPAASENCSWGPGSCTPPLFDGSTLSTPPPPRPTPQSPPSLTRRSGRRTAPRASASLMSAQHEILGCVPSANLRPQPELC